MGVTEEFLQEATPNRNKKLFWRRSGTLFCFQRYFALEILDVAAGFLTRWLLFASLVGVAGMASW
jgi:hypothetical protein